MLIKYLFFCLGCALLQNAFVKTPNFDNVDARAILDVPLGFNKLGTKIIVLVVALLALVSEIIIGIVLIEWWAGLFLWIPALVVVGIILPSRNPAPSFILGLLIVVISSLFLFT